MAKEKILSNDVRRVISELAVDGYHVRIEAQLDRPLYLKVNEVLEAIGGKWNRKAKAHSFEHDPSDLIEDVLLTGRFEKLGRAFDFFETPREVAVEVVQRAWIKAGQSVLEPSAGRGALTDVVREFAPSVELEACEINPDNRQVLNKKNVVIVGNDFVGPHWVPRIGGYDRVVMNPPFSKQQDIDHVTRAFALLAPGGRLVSVMGASVTFRTNKKTTDFTRLVGDNRGEIEPLPEASFKASGTNVNTVMVTIPKAG